MKRIKGILLVLLVAWTTGYAQKTWTLEECIEYALENNIQLKRRQLQSESASNNFDQSLLRVLPTVTGFANHDYNSGRALNYDTYQWENREFEQGNLGMESQLNVFSGFQNYNNIQQQRFLLLTRLQEVERAKNDISMNISAAFFQVLLDRELAELAEMQAGVSSLELESARSNFSLGNISRGRVLEIESQVAADQYQVTMARNNLSRSYLDLIQIMQMDPSEDFQVALPEISEVEEAPILQTVDNIYDQAESSLPRIKGAEYYLRSTERELAIMRGQQSPRLALRGLFYSRYSELAVDPMNGGNYPYSKQIKDNQYRQLSLSLSIPIFNGWSTRNRISNAKVSMLDARYQLDETKQDLYSEIHQMHNDAMGAYNRYKSAEKAVAAARESFQFAREQFRLGMINFIEYQNAQSSLFRSQSNMAQAKYEYYLRSMILDFYLGEQFTL